MQWLRVIRGGEFHHSWEAILQSDSILPYIVTICIPAPSYEIENCWLELENEEGKPFDCASSFIARLVSTPKCVAQLIVLGIPLPIFWCKRGRDIRVDDWFQRCPRDRHYLNRLRLGVLQPEQYCFVDRYVVPLRGHKRRTTGISAAIWGLIGIVLGLTNVAFPPSAVADTELPVLIAGMLDLLSTLVGLGACL